MNLSRLLNKVRLLGVDWARIEVGALHGFSLTTGEHAVAHIVTHGNLLLQMEQVGTVALGCGSVVILPHGRPHSLRQEAGSIREPIRYFDDVHDVDIPPTILIGPKEASPAVVLTAQLHLDWPAELPLARCLPPIMMGTRSYRIDTSAAASAARALELTAIRPGATTCLSRFAELILIRELRDVLVAHPELMDMRDELTATIVRAIDAVRMKPDHPWTVERLAHHVGMSRSTFAAAFKQIYDQSPMEAVAAKRMEIAARMLCDRHSRVKTVAARVGYNSDTAFLRRFICHFGVSPTIYKKQNVGRQAEEREDWLSLLR